MIQEPTDHPVGNQNPPRSNTQANKTLDEYFKHARSFQGARDCINFLKELYSAMNLAVDLQYPAWWFRRRLFRGQFVSSRYTLCLQEETTRK